MRILRTTLTLTIVSMVAAMMSPGALHAGLIAYYDGEETGAPLYDQVSGQPTTLSGDGHLYQQSSVPAGTYGDITLAVGHGSALGISGSNNGSWRLGTDVSATLGALTNNFTVMAWIYVPEGGLPDGEIKRVIGRDLAFAPQGWAFGVRNKAGWANTISFVGNGVAEWGTIDNTITTGWQHIAVTKSSTTGVTFFHNGIDVGLRNNGLTMVNDNLNTTTDAFAVGRGNNLLELSWNKGLLFDEVRVYDSVLSRSQIIAAAIPEPNGAVMLLFGAIAGLLWRRR